MLNIEEINSINEELKKLYILRVSGKFGMIEYHMKWTKLLKEKASLLNLPSITINNEQKSNVRKIG